MFILIGLVAVGQGVAMNAGRPSVFLNAQELVRLRVELKTVGWKRDLFEGKPTSGNMSITMVNAGTKTNADLRLNKEIEIPARGGHGHNFFCDDGTALIIPSNEQPDPNGYPCPACGKVYKGQRYDDAVRLYVHHRLALAAFDLALTYAIEQDPRYAAKAAEILTKYAHAYPGSHTSYNEGGIMQQSLNEAMWIIPLAGGYDLIYDSGAMSAADKKLIENKLFRPVAKGFMAFRIGGNWSSWHLSAVGVIGYAIRDQQMIEYAIDGFKGQMTRELGDDGIWPESIHTYHFFVAHAFLYLAEAARHNGADLYHYEPKPGKSLESMFTAPLPYAYPDSRLPAVNDGWFDTFLPLDIYELAYARYDTDELGWALKAGYETRKTPRTGAWALLYGRPLEKDFPAPELHSTNYPGVGIAVLRSPRGNVMTFDYGPFLGHGQPDKMGITLFANGSLMAADYGTPGYGSASMHWYSSTMAHNTVVVDGKTQARTKERQLTRFAGSPTFEVAEAETEQAYPGVLHKRTVIRVGESFIVIDRLKSKDKHTYDWFFRSEGNLQFSGEAVTKPLGYQYVDEKSQLATDAAWDARWVLDGKGLDLFMLDAHPSLVTAAECPAETTARKIPLLIVRKEGREAVFIAVLAPYNGESKVECSESNGLIKLEHDGVTDWVFVKESGRSKTLQTDGDFALVRTESSQPILSSIIGGKSVTWKGRVQPLE